MIRILSHLRLYDLSENSLIIRELTCYSFYLDYLQNQINSLLDSCAFYKIDQKSYSNYCTLFELPTTITNEKLKDIVFKRMTIDPMDFTIVGIKKCLLALGFEVIIIEGTVTPIVKVTVVNDDNLFYHQTEKEEAIKKCFPVNLNVAIIWNVS